MNGKKLILSCIAGFIVMFLLAGLWHMALMSDLYTTPSSREEPLMGFIALGLFILALLMAYLYPKGYSGGSPVTEGLKFGILVGLMWVLPLGLILYAVQEGYTLNMVIVDAIWHMVEEGVGGIVIGLVYGRQAVPAAGQ